METSTRTQHTPGPWHLEPEEWTGGESIVVCAQYENVAIVTGHPAYDAQTLADARLIASAPLMETTLSAIIEHAAPLVQSGDPLGLAIDRMARAALREAHGDAKGN